MKFDIINAETQWGILKDAYNEIDNEILIWEKSRNLKRDGKSVVSIESLETQLEKLKVTLMFLTAGYDAAESFQEIITIIIIQKCFSPLNSPRDNMVQRSGNIYSRFAWHYSSLSKDLKPANLFS